ncbi:hypothetical protein CSA37_00755 [Candidatus Fermentibacteria bacterium]|nr:MAG: hypothetical protein CSA37_00755 [Candidatus Fermentibacteria bacterium]
MAEVNIQKLLSGRDEKGLIQALSCKADKNTLYEVSKALESIGTIDTLAVLVSLFSSEDEEADTRIAAMSVAGKICAGFINEQNKTDADQLSPKEKQLEGSAEIDKTILALKHQMNNSSGEVSIGAARVLMKIPMGKVSVFNMDGFESEPESDPAIIVQNKEGGEKNKKSLSLKKSNINAEKTKSIRKAKVSDKTDQKKVYYDSAGHSVNTELERFTKSAAALEKPVEPVAEVESGNSPEGILPVDGMHQNSQGESEVRMMPLVNVEKPVEIAPDTWWVGRREDTLLERNIYLRVFRNGDKTLNLLIDPGPPEDLTPLVGKLTELIGGVRKLNIMFLNHQDPDVSYNAGHIQKLNPGCVVLCSEDSWRLVKFYGLNEKMYKCTESFTGGTATFNTGHKVQFIPTPYCHFRGATMLYDYETGILFSGDFMGGLSFLPDLYASEGSWDGIVTFHQIYMPSKAALQHAVGNIRELPELPKMIAPQHGSILHGELVENFLTKMDNLDVGLDLFLKESARKNYVTALNELLVELSRIVDSSKIDEVMNSFASDSSFPDTFTIRKNSITGIKVDAQYAVDLFLKEIRKNVPAEKLDLIDTSIIKTLTMWKIPLPEFFKGQEMDKESLFS